MVHFSTLKMQKLDIKMTAQQVKVLEKSPTSKPLAFIDKVGLVHFNDLQSVF